MSSSVLEFRVASQPWEFEQIHRLNYRTFVEEIPQHAPRPDRRLVDAFHEQNTYIVAVQADRVVGMLAVRGERPFSLDRKLPDLDQYLPAGCRPCEVRLLAVEPAHRHGAVFRGLINTLVPHCRARQYDRVLISGTVRQMRLYRHLGFVPFGPLVGTPAALYQPMGLTREALQDHARTLPNLAPERDSTP